MTVNKIVMETRSRRREVEKKRMEAAYTTDTDEEEDSTILVMTTGDGREVGMAMPPNFWPTGRGRGRGRRADELEEGGWADILARRSSARTEEKAEGQVDGRQDEQADDQPEDDKFEDADESDGCDEPEPEGITLNVVLRHDDKGVGRLFRVGEAPPPGYHTSTPAEMEAKKAAANKRAVSSDSTNTSDQDTKPAVRNAPKKKVKTEAPWEVRDREHAAMVKAFAEKLQGESTFSRRRADGRSDSAPSEDASQPDRERAGTSATLADKRQGLGRGGPRKTKLPSPGGIRASEHTGIMRHADVGGPLTGHDLVFASDHPEGETTCEGPQPNRQLAYPYWRRYAMKQPDHDPDCYFRAIGAIGEQETTMDRRAGARPRLHDDIRITMEEADGNLRRNLDTSSEVPGVPDIFLPALLNSSIHDHWHQDFSPEPFLRPPLSNLRYAASHRWMPVQRGALQRMEELVRLAILNHSTTLTAKELQKTTGGKQCMGLTTEDVLDYATDQSTRVLIELYHQLTYAHRRAYVRHAPDDVQRNVLRQATTEERLLFTP